MADYIEREVPWDDQYISKTDAIKLAAIIVVPFATSENIQDIHKAFERTIDKYPAADVQPVKHGKWIKSRQFAYTRYTSVFTCSECNKSGRSNYNYCPNCGARMEVDG